MVGTAQQCDVNSLSRCNAKFSIIASSDTPVNSSESLNRQPHSEQPKPQCDSLIHTGLRLMDAWIATLQRAPACMKARNVQPHHQRFLPQRVLSHGAQNHHPPKRGGRFTERMGKVYFCQYWTVCRASYITGRFVRGTSDFVDGRLKRAGPH